MNSPFMKYNPYLSFGTCARMYPAHKDIQHGQVQTITSMFRNDLNWVGLVKFMEQNFENKDNVNTYCLASSDGTEPYTFAITVLDRVPQKDCSKYLPIVASDIDEEVINTAKSGKINLGDSDFFKISQNTIKDRSYFKYVGNMVDIKDDVCRGVSNYSAYEPMPVLAESVEFEKADILEKLKGIKDDGNSVILCRNVFRYLQPNYIDEVVKTAGENLKSGSLFVIGDEDEGSGIKDKLIEAGFEEKMYNVLRKV